MITFQRHENDHTQRHGDDKISTTQKNDFLNWCAQI